MEHIDQQTHEQFMRRTMELATLGRGLVSPNPLVGCVIVVDGKIVGEGWHQRYGGPHAEVNAVASVADRSLLPLSTVYVNLEPCSHFGKTPPCADMLVREKVKRVVISNVDSNPLVGGAGIKKLESAGIEIITGILADEGRELNKRFFTFIEKRRPYIVLKWAQTTDGFIARENHDSKWISGELSRQLVHRWRAEEDAILVGRSTAAYDDPQLNVRDWSGRNPVRIVIDPGLKLDPKLKLFDQTQRTICYNRIRNDNEGLVQYVRIDGEDFVAGLIKHLYEQNIQSVIIEGGSKTLQTFIDFDLWDEARIFISKQRFGKGISVPVITGCVMSETQVGADLLSIIYHH